jgi:hypothetical protein
MPDAIAPLNHETAPQFVCDQLGVPGCIILISCADGSIGLSAHGVNHARANELLSVGIHINLTQHDQLVRAGAAGEAAQRQAEDIAVQGGFA